MSQNSELSSYETQVIKGGLGKGLGFEMSLEGWEAFQ